MKTLCDNVKLILHFFINFTAQWSNVKLRTDLFLHMMCGRVETTLGSSFEHEEHVYDFIQIVQGRDASFVDHAVYGLELITLSRYGFAQNCSLSAITKVAEKRKINLTRYFHYTRVCPACFATTLRKHSTNSATSMKVGDVRQ